MRIAILEVCTHTHYSAINGLIKTYSSDPNNTIVLYTIELNAKAVRENGIKDNTTLVVYNKNETMSHFFKEIEQVQFDVLHICTLKGYYEEFTKFKPNAREVILHIHNVDIWYGNDWKRNIGNLSYAIKHEKEVIRSVAKIMRDILIRNPRRKQILKNLQSRKHRFIVHSQGQKKYLSEFISDEHIIVFPFAINEGIEKPLIVRAPNDKIRICIPGIVTNTRRDYNGLFTILEAILPDIKNQIMFDFLGYVEKSEPELLQRIQNLEQNGLEVVYYTEFVYGDKYDAALEKADILLNNQIVVVSHTAKYGVTKESGMLFNMIRGSKPGILPLEYGVDKEFEGTFLYYNSSTELRDIILGLALGHIEIESYKAKAIEVAQNYTPRNLYERLVKSDTVNPKAPPQYSDVL